MIVCGDSRALPLASACVDCVITSPPYFGLRDYDDPRQIGLEDTPAAYVEALVTVFREVRRVLKPTGVCWLNLGDTYAANRGYQVPDSKWIDVGNSRGMKAASLGVKPKDLIGIPWMTAFALRDDGWYLRSDVIWHKPNPMPESVTDRPTKSHEYVFLLAKSDSYFYDADAIKEPYEPESFERYKYAFGGAKNIQLAADNVEGIGRRTSVIGMRPYRGQATKDYDSAGAQNPSDTKRRILDSMENGAGRNKRTVWTINTQPYEGAHFATFPEALVEPCLLAGCPAGGLVLDPFLGSGTVGVVAERTSRRWVGVDLAYHDQSRERTAQRGLRFDYKEELHGKG